MVLKEGGSVSLQPEPTVGGGGGSAHMIDSMSKGCMVGLGISKRIVSFNFL